MAITVSPTFAESETGEVITDFNVNHHHELHRGLAPEYIDIDDATGDYQLHEEPTYSEEGEWSYSPDVVSRNPVLSSESSDREVALYWLTPGSISDQELAAMLDGLENYDGIDRINREALIAFKGGDIEFTDLPIELQQELIAASGYEFSEEPQVEGEAFEAFEELMTTEADPDLISVFDDLASDVDDPSVSFIAGLSARFHGGEDAESLITEAVQYLGQEEALSAYYKLINLIDS